MRDNVIRLAFGGDAEPLEEFCTDVRRPIPAGTAAVLRGSAVTGLRHSDNAPFDADGAGHQRPRPHPRGRGGVALYKIAGFFIPGVHSRPLSEEDPDIAPDLVPAARAAHGDGRPPREHPGHARLDHVRARARDGAALPDAAAASSRRREVRLLSYNIRFGGVGRVAALAAVVEPVRARRGGAPGSDAARRGRGAGRGHRDGAWALAPGHSVGFMSRLRSRTTNGTGRRASRRAFLEIVPEGEPLRIFGVHLSAVHSNWTERRRVRELRAVLAGIAEHQHGFHVRDRGLQHPRPRGDARPRQAAAAAARVRVADRPEDPLGDDPDHARRRATSTGTARSTPPTPGSRFPPATRTCASTTCSCPSPSRPASVVHRRERHARRGPGLGSPALDGRDRSGLTRRRRQSVLPRRRRKIRRSRRSGVVGGVVARKARSNCRTSCSSGVGGGVRSS